MKWIKATILRLFPKLRKKTKVEMWQENAEQLVIASGINLENVLVHNYGLWGKCGIRNYWDCVEHKDANYGDIKITIPHLKEPFIIVPEIKGWWSYHAWIHEIAHYKMKHYDSTKPTFITEYEAEKVTYDWCEKADCVDPYDLISIKYEVVGYLDHHIKKAIESGVIKYKESIPDEVYEFLYMCDYMKEVMEERKLPLKDDVLKERHKRFDRYYR
jgi:hypothetical protein